MILLLTVTDVILARGPGALLLPRIAVPVSERARFHVELRFPDGTRKMSEAVFQFPHVSGPQVPLAMLHICDLTPSEIPVGTEVWRVGHSA